MLTKQCFFIGVFVLLFSSMVIAAPPAVHPKTGEPLVIDCLRGAPTAIDGNLNDWVLDFLTPAVLDTKEQIYSGVAPGAAGWDGPEDCSGKFYFLWDDENIYIGAVVKDDKIVTTQAGGDIWKTDCIEMFFADTEAVACPDCHNHHYQYGVTPKNQRWNWCNMDGAGQREPDYLQIASTITDDGYICEVAIKYDQMKSLDFKTGNAIGLHPCLDDADDPAGTRKLQMTWTGREAHDQSLGFGQMVLSSETMAVSAEGKLPLTWGSLKNKY